MDGYFPLLNQPGAFWVPTFALAGLFAVRYLVFAGVAWTHRLPHRRAIFPVVHRVHRLSINTSVAHNTQHATAKHTYGLYFLVWDRLMGTWHDPELAARKDGIPAGVLVQGGSPPFRVQRCADLATGSWQSDELNFATNATTVSWAPQQYFRVLQLGQ